MRRALAALLVLAAALPGCTLLGGAGDAAPEPRHVVFLTTPDCPWVVAQSAGDRFAVLKPSDTLPRPGDVLVGELRGGHASLRLIPFPSHQVAGTIGAEVAGAALTLTDAQALWRARCPT